MKNHLTISFLEQTRTSSYQDQIYTDLRDDYQDSIERFIKNAVTRGEIASLPLEIYWSIAFSPLLTLIRAHYEGQRSGEKPFKLNEAVLWQTFNLVVKALKIN